MNKNATPILLIIISIGIYFTFTSSRIEELKSVQAVNAEYAEAVSNIDRLVAERDAKNDKYESIPIEYREGLDKMLPSNIDNIRLIIDVNGVAARHGFTLKNIKVDTPESADQDNSGDFVGEVGVPSDYNTAKLSFSVNATYDGFVGFMKDLESSLRIINVSNISVSSGGSSSTYEYDVVIETYWLKQL